MSKHIVQMGPMLVLAGMAIGWMADVLSRAGGYGFYDMALGLIGSTLAGVTLWIVANQAGMPMTVLVGCAGATLMITAQRSIWRSTAPGT